MADLLHMLAGGKALSARAADELHARGFVVLPDVIPPDRLDALRTAYDHAVESASGSDIKVGTTSIRVTDSSTGALSSMRSTPGLLCSRRAVW